MEIEMEMQNQTQNEFNNNDEYYQSSSNDIDNYADDENSVNTIDYVNDVDNDVFIDNEEENKHELYNLIDKLKYFTLNENKIIIYQPNQPNQPYQSYQPYHSTPQHCIIQMEF
jgi:hypothetical protein